MHRAADGQVAVQQVDVIQDPQPVVLPTTDERQVLRARVTDVARDVPAVLSRPPERDRRRMPVALQGEIAGECQRDDELKECAAEDVHELAERGEHQVTRLVDGEVDVVHEAEVARMRGQVPAIRSEQERDGQPGVVPPARDDRGSARRCGRPHAHSLVNETALMLAAVLREAARKIEMPSYHGRPSRSCHPRPAARPSDNAHTTATLPSRCAIHHLTPS